ncbi:hypothetical protein O181_028390 [Austropuccinia psidii MF-1]|uniref:Uncharacterized protein n=1 Tax=Austropuccinia psidii MF-1 TaxID=1389203 RepID=A0A9Q3CT79_9BASI|nr:hypothetical protein [Austropuccinia psidii MF-1]
MSQRSKCGSKSTIHTERKRAKKINSEEEEENAVGEEDSNSTEGVPAPVGASQHTGGPTLAQSNQPVSHQSESSLWDIMQQITNIMANLQSASSSEETRPQAFKTTSMKEPECFDGTQPFKVRSFVQSCQLIFYNDPANSSQDIIIKYEAELYYLRMKERGHFLLYIAHFRSLASRIGYRGERALIHHFRKVFPSRILDQLASHPSRIESLQDLMDVTLELDPRYHERQMEKIHHQENNPEASKSNSSHPQNSSSSNQKKKQNF